MEHISVVISTYNRKQLLHRAIQSVLNQTYSAFEILVCDDGSTDTSEQLVQEFADTRIKWLSGKHSGLPAVPRNRGIAASQCEWLAFLDSDDEWLPHKLEQQVQFIKENQVKAVCSNGYRVFPDASTQPTLFHTPGKFPFLRSNQLLPFHELLRINYVICSSAMIHRSLFHVAEGFPESPKLKAVEDYALWLRIATQTSFGYIAAPLVNYQDDPKTSVRKADSALIQNQKLRFLLDNLLQWDLANSTLSQQQAQKVKKRSRALRQEQFTYFYQKIRGLLYSFVAKSS